LDGYLLHACNRNIDQFYSPPGGEGGVNRELLVWPPACPKCCAQETALRYDDVLDRIGCTCGRCKYGWRVPPRDIPEPAAIPSAAEGDGGEKEQQPNEGRTTAEILLAGWAVESMYGDPPIVRRQQQWAWDVIQQCRRLRADCAALRAERDGWESRAVACIRARDVAIAERDALQKRIDEGEVTELLQDPFGRFYCFVGFCVGSRVRVLLEGE
jgi:hypothetical protein